jgi:hypothetical protein
MKSESTIWKVGTVSFFILFLLMQLKACSLRDELSTAIEGRSRVDSLFEQQGKKMKDITDDHGSKVKQVKALQLSNAQLSLLVQDKDAYIKGLKPVALIQNHAEVRIDTVETVLHDTLPCAPFDISFHVKEEWYAYGIRLTNHTHVLSGLSIPFVMTTTITERSRFLRGPEINANTKFDNPYLHLTQSSVAVEKKKKGFKVMNVVVPFLIGVAGGIYLGN